MSGGISVDGGNGGLMVPANSSCDADLQPGHPFLNPYMPIGIVADMPIGWSVHRRANGLSSSTSDARRVGPCRGAGRIKPSMGRDLLGWLGYVPGCAGR